MLLIFTIVYALGMLLYYLGFNVVASALIMALAIFLYVREFLFCKKIINVRGIFGLSFIGGFGLSLLKLSNLSSKYNVMTFIVVFAAYFSLYVGSYVASKKEYKTDNIKVNQSKDVYKKPRMQNVFIVLLLVLTLISFITEVIILKYVPLFTVDTPHAYSDFHVFGLHYITTLYIFIPSFAICNFFFSNKKSFAMILVSILYLIIMSLLMVSRSKLIMGLTLALFTLLIFGNDTIRKYFTDKNYRREKSVIKVVNGIIITACLFVVIFIALYVVITIYRAHDITYLNSIFDMKDKNMPIFITQPYMYIAHNYENLNYMIEHTFRWTFGRRILYPFFSLTLIKKFFPIVADSPYYVIKQELSTVTLVYDFYYDFGLPGVVIFCFLIGYIGRILEEKTYILITKEAFHKNNYITVLFALYCYYMFFSFFETYFSLTDTWVHIIFISFVMLVIKMSNHNIKMQKVVEKKEENIVSV